MENFDNLVKLYRGIIIYLINKEQIPLSYFDDAIQIALIALHNSNITFQEGKGSKFGSWIRNGIIQSLKNFKRCISKDKFISVETIQEFEHPLGSGNIDYVDNKDMINYCFSLVSPLHQRILNGIYTNKSFIEISHEEKISKQFLNKEKKRIIKTLQRRIKNE